MGKIGEVPDRAVVDLSVGRRWGQDGSIRPSVVASLTLWMSEVNPRVCTMPFDEGLKWSTELRRAAVMGV
jgi:hypothetical protein